MLTNSIAPFGGRLFHPVMSVALRFLNRGFKMHLRKYTNWKEEKEKEKAKEEKEPKEENEGGQTDEQIKAEINDFLYKSQFEGGSKTKKKAKKVV